LRKKRKARKGYISNTEERKEEPTYRPLFSFCRIVAPLAQGGEEGKEKKKKKTPCGRRGKNKKKKEIRATHGRVGATSFCSKKRGEEKKRGSLRLYHDQTRERGKKGKGGVPPVSLIVRFFAVKREG